MDRFEKMEWLRETCTEEFVKTSIIDEMVMFMSDEYFAQFYEHLCSCWNIAESPEELDKQLNGG